MRDKQLPRTKALCGHCSATWSHNTWPSVRLKARGTTQALKGRGFWTTYVSFFDSGALLVSGTEFPGTSRSQVPYEVEKTQDVRQWYMASVATSVGCETGYYLSRAFVPRQAKPSTQHHPFVPSKRAREARARRSVFDGRRQADCSSRRACQFRILKSLSQGMKPHLAKDPYKFHFRPRR